MAVMTARVEGVGAHSMPLSFKRWFVSELRLGKENKTTLDGPLSTDHGRL